MGRPINKRFFGTGAGNQIKVRAKIGANAEGDGFIVSQRGTRRFRVTVGSNTKICTLVNKDQGSLAANEMIVNVRNDAGDLVRVTKMFNRTAIVGGAKTKWNFNPSNEDNAVQVKDIDGSVITITGQPANQTVVAPAAATFTVTATADPTTTLTYQWQVQTAGAGAWKNIAGATSPTFVIDPTTVELSTNKYRVRVGAEGSAVVTSNGAATLTVTAE